MDAFTCCLELQPSKPQARASGLNMPVENLNPMDWLSTDLAQKVLRNGKKVNFLVIVDRASGFVRVYQLRGMKTKHIIECLQEFVEAYCGPPYWITSNGGPQFAATTQGIKEWCVAFSIAHKLSSANNPEGKGKAERGMQRCKQAIAHAPDDLKNLQGIITNVI